ncbi:hypothetical protein C8A00DRAFT_45843 [Chaetomidium leptoderma]|uniref:Uncharacterized protein n=1 Tax=Chaetomidium leptoderma TaxID=669021 RepID=A0AAN6VG67_9PEZI|nr:hypothetical protein C8A00DRAFT_45843 [Chaetomidium leptoderma]
MSRPTPRKSRHRHHASNSGPRQVAASDYESDAAQYMEDRDMALPPNPQPARDNTELSLRVLRRHQPNIRSIIAIAANAVAYNFLEATQGWEKHGAEGTMFLCEQEPIVVPTGQVLPRVCVFVLNRRSMENLVVDFLRVTDCEVVGELIVFRMEGDSAGGNGHADEGTAAKKILGLWIHADEVNTREVHANLILGAWQQGRQAFDAYIQAATAGAQEGGAFASESQAGAATRGTDDTQNSMCPTTEGDNVIAAALQTQLALVSSFEQWLAERTEADADEPRIDLVSRIQRRLGNYRRWLLEVEQTPSTISEDVGSWAMDARVRSGSDDGSVIAVTGPGSGDPIEITAKDKEEPEYLMSDNYLGYMVKICHAFAKSQNTLRSLLQTTNEMEEGKSKLSQPPEVTVKTYIRRLQDYNDVKDIGQQLIGLIAENRGVPVRTLYEGGEYGVSIPRR